MFSILLSLTPALQAPSPFRIESANGRVTSLRAAGDTLNTEYLASGAALGDVHVATRKGGGAWQAQEAHDLAVDPNGTGASWRAGDDVEVHSGFERQGDRLVWRFRLTNRASVPVEVGDLSTPLPMRTRADKDSKAFVLKHSFVSGAGSFLFWMRPDSRGPYLTITPLRGTSPEYWARGGGPYAVYVHSAAEAPKVAENKGSWRLPRTSRTLKPGESAEYGYAFSWSKDYAGVRDAVAQAGGLDVQVAPGMTVPRDLYADVAIRSSRAIEGIDAEFPQATTIRLLGARGATASTE